MRKLILALAMLSLPPTVSAQVEVQVGLPSAALGIEQPSFPRMVAVAGHPVYYASSGNSNYFFYDGMYWVYRQDNWYASSWYDGPWTRVAPVGVPSLLLCVPVRFYRHPPAYFRGWSQDAPPRWDEHWGREWIRERAGWGDRDRGITPPAAPLPVYQRQYAGNRYPHPELQQALQKQNYHHQPGDPAVRKAYAAQGPHHGLPPSRQSSLPSPRAERGMANPHDDETR